MMSRQAGRQTLTALVTHKQESLQYLTVDSATYLHWRTLARTLNLSSDCDVAAFLLQHYEKTSDLQMTQCVKCAGPVVQYCVPCNIYMTQPTSPPPSLLPHDTSALSVCDDAILSSDTILLDLGDVVGTDQFLLHDISLKMDGKVDSLVAEEKKEMTSVAPFPLDKTRGLSVAQTPDCKEPGQPSKLRMLMETCCKEGFKPQAASPPTTPKSKPPAKSLLTPDVLQKLKSKVQTLAESAPFTPASDGIVAGSVGVGGTPPSSAVVEPQKTWPSQRAVETLGQSTLESSSLLETARKETERSSSTVQPPGTAAAQLCAKSSLTIVMPEKDTQCLLASAPSVKEAEGVMPSVTGQSEGQCRPLSQKETKCPSIVTSAKESKCSSILRILKQTECQSLTETSLNKAECPSFTLTSAEDSHCLSSIQTIPKESDGVLSIKTLQKESECAPWPGTSSEKPNRPPSPLTGQKAAALPLAPLVGSQPRTETEEAKEPSQTPDGNPASIQLKSVEGALAGEVPRRFTAEALDSKPDMTVQNATTLEDEDSDYHCEPLFTSTGQHHESGIDDTCTREDVIPLNSATSSRAKASSKTRCSPRKHCRTRFNRKESRKRRHTSVSDVLGKSKGLDQHVIIVTDHTDDPSHQRQDNNQSLTPVYRSKRIAARMAAKAQASKLEETSSENRVAGCKVGKASRTVREKVKSDKVSEEDHEVTDDGSKANGADCKVSIIVESDSPSDLSTAAVQSKRRRDSLTTEAKSYLCPLCGEEFQLRRDRTVHIRERHGDRPYTCTQCPATYTMASHLRVHRNQHSDVKPHACSLCPGKFARAHDLKVHQMTHSKERPVVCEVCGITLKTFRFLKSHMRTHNHSDKPFICQLCGKTFRWRCNLTDHLRIHNNDKRFTCPDCGIRCIQSGSLRRHMERKHNPNRPRPFVCDVCGEARFDKTQFEKHLMIHSGEKPFVCEVCGAAFIQANALVGHKKIHTEREGKSHLCSLCGAAFKALSSVKKHMNKVHNTGSSQLSFVAVEIIDLP